MTSMRCTGLPYSNWPSRSYEALLTSQQGGLAMMGQSSFSPAPSQQHAVPSIGRAAWRGIFLPGAASRSARFCRPECALGRGAQVRQFVRVDPATRCAPSNIRYRLAVTLPPANAKSTPSLQTKTPASRGRCGLVRLDQCVTPSASSRCSTLLEIRRCPPVVGCTPSANR